MPYQLIAQGIGFCGMLLAVLSFQQNSRARIACFQMIACIFWIAHFGLLHAWAGMAMNVIGVFRGLICSRKGLSRWASGAYWPYVFSAVSVVACLCTWDGWRSLLPVFAMVVTSFGLWANRPRVVRRLNLPGSLLWLTYNALSGSWAGTLTECCNTVSIVVAMFRFDRAKGLTKQEK